MIADRLSMIKPSPTLRVSAKAKDMRRQGLPVIDFSVGEPDFNTPEHIKKEAVRAIEANFTKYTQADGIPELKEAIVERLRCDERLDYQSGQVLVSPGAKACLFFALAALVNTRDEVIVPSPYWVSYIPQVQMVGGTPIVVETKASDGFQLQPSMLKKAISSRTKILILNNPCNPTGTVYDPDCLKEIIDMVVSKNIIIIADEIYSKIVFKGAVFKRSATFSDQAFEHTITIDGVSKAYSMTGWRIGFAAGPQKIINAMKSIQGHVTSNAASISQKAALEAYHADQSSVGFFKEQFEKRRDYVYSELTKINDMTCVKPAGTFYIFPDIHKFFGLSDGSTTIQNDVDLCEYLLEKAHVAAVPGEGFGTADFIRLSFAASMDDLKIGIQRIKNALDALRNH
ncbi:pyridoxal phosphate-dependent aminotransferase [bacterium]|nr:pyridoxal phosphate-dependent aminotransferase [candidate division CSSED10-310 bacterium]